MENYDLHLLDVLKVQDKMVDTEDKATGEVIEKPAYEVYKMGKDMYYTIIDIDNVYDVVTIMEISNDVKLSGNTRRIWLHAIPRIFDVVGKLDVKLNLK